MRISRLPGALCCLLIGLSHANGQTEIDGEKLLAQSDFLLTYPASWSLDQSGQMGTQFILFTGQNNDGFRDNLNLITQDLKGSGFDLDKYAALSEGQVKTMITSATILESKRIKTGTSEFHEIIFAGDQGVFHLKWRQRYWVIGDKAFVLTFTANQVTYAGYDQLNQKVFDSFKIK